MEKKRIFYLDGAKGVGIIMIMILHLFHGEEPVKGVLNIIGLSLFFVVSGIIAAKNNELSKPWKSFALSKFKGLIIPYIFFGIIYLLINLIKRRNLSLFMATSFKLFVGAGISVLWFLSALFLSSILFHFIMNLRCKIAIKYSFICGFSAISLLIVNLFNLSTLIGLKETTLMVFVKPVVLLPFLLLGYSIEKKAFLQKHSFKLGLALTVAAVILALCNGFTDINGLILGKSVILFYLSGALGSTGVILLCTVIENASWAKVLRSFLGFFGVNSLLIMCTHEYLGVRFLAEKIGTLLPCCNLLASIAILIAFESLIVVLFGKPFKKLFYNFGKKIINN